MNQSNCSFTIHTEGFDGSSEYLEVTEGIDSSNYTVKYNAEINGSRMAQVPITINCDITSHVATVNLTLRNRGVMVSTNESKSFSQAKLSVSGDNRLDRDNSNVTLLIIPTELSGFSME